MINALLHAVDEHLLYNDSIANLPTSALAQVPLWFITFVKKITAKNYFKKVLFLNFTPGCVFSFDADW